jgi:ubiquinone/menaquinone biosynthesis C-methylase UbiE
VEKSNYKDYLKLASKDYFIKSLKKTEQQKFLESILPRTTEKKEIADVACGAGTLSYHLNHLYESKNQFTLIDYFDDALKLAKEINSDENFNFYNYDITNLPNNFTEKFDLVFCWQTLSWIEDPESAINELIKITKKGGKIYLSALFNIDHDVDIYSKVFDKSNKSVEAIGISYNTFSELTVKNWIEDSVKSYQFLKFSPLIDLVHEGRGIGTYTINTDKGRIQVSAGVLMNWYILEITK